jgi:hypothetical protein
MRRRVGEVLDRVTTQKRRQVGAFGFEELWEAGHEKAIGQIQEIRNILAGDNSWEFGAVIGKR